MLLPTILMIAAASVHALPKSVKSRPPLPSYFILSNGTRVEHYSPPEFRPAPMGPIDYRTFKRQDAPSEIEVGGEDVVAQDLNAGPDEFPQAFSQLFDYVNSDICGEIGCQFGAEYCVTAATGSDVCIEAQGSYRNSSREAFIRSTRGSFDRAVRRQRPGQGVIETGPHFIHLIAPSGPLGDGNLRVQLRNEAKGGGSGGPSCGPFISTIAAGGALFPQVAAPFGALSFFCGATDAFAGTATGRRKLAQ